LIELSLVVPAYNEEKNIVSVVNHMTTFLDIHFNNYELIVVDDGSQDQTVQVLQTIDHTRLVIHPLGTNQGKGQAIKEGMALARGKYCFFTDADLPYPLSSLTDAIKEFKNHQCDLVIGSRHHDQDHEKDYPLLRKIMSKVFSLYTGLILNLGITDTQCGFKGFTHQAKETIFPLVTIKGFGFDVEMLFIAKNRNYVIKTIPVNMTYTEDSKVNVIKDSLKMFWDTLRVRVNQLKKKYK